jgi:hypothetical protein
MSYRIGDTLFSSSAAPATVAAVDETGSRVKIDRDFSAFQVNTRHGLQNDMATDQREQFNQIMDEVVANKDSQQRVNLLMQRIDELKPDPKNHRLVTYLDGEARHIMNTKGIKARYYTTEGFKVR